MNFPSIFKASNQPARMFSQIQRDFDRLYSELSSLEPLLKSEMACNCELSEDKNNFMFKFDMPGVKKSDVKIQIEGNVFTVSAERSEEKKSDSKKNRYSEITYGSYQRSFTLPESVDESKVDAKFENGVLSVTIPKTQNANAKQIPIQ